MGQWKIVKIRINDRIGTAFYLSERYLITAGHNLSPDRRFIAPGTKVSALVSNEKGETIREYRVIECCTDDFIDCAILIDDSPVSSQNLEFDFCERDSKIDVIIQGYSNSGFESRSASFDGYLKSMSDSNLFLGLLKNVSIKPGMSGSPVFTVDGEKLLGFAVNRDIENYNECYFVPLKNLRSNPRLSPYLSIQNFNSEISLAKPFKSTRLLAHFIDHYVLQQQSLIYPLDRLITEASKALFYGLLVADRLYIPAVSYFESSVCRRLVNMYNFLFETGAINIVGDGDDLIEFFDIRMTEYPFYSKQFLTYRLASSIRRDIPPYLSIEDNTTDSIRSAWPHRFIKSDGDPPKALDRELLVQNWDNIIDDLETNLDGKALVFKNISKLILKRSSKRSDLEILSSINEVFFDNLALKLSCSFFDDLPFFDRGGPTLKSSAVSYSKLINNIDYQTAYSEWCSARSAINFYRIREQIQRV